MEFSIGGDPTAGSVTLKLNDDVIETFNAYNNNSIVSECTWWNFNKTGLSDQLWVATVLADTQSPGFLRRISRVVSLSLQDHLH